MKVVINNIIPFKGYVAITLWPFIFVRKAVKENVIRHEEIHGQQQKEMLIVLFYLWYAVEYLVRLVICRSHKEAYRNISFEQEAYLFEGDPSYSRKPYAWLKYVTKKTYQYGNT